MIGRYQYVVIRYVPNVVRDEAVNIGVMVRSLDVSEFGYRFLPRTSVVRKLWPTADDRLVGNFERELKSIAGTQPSLFTPDHPLIERFGHPEESTFFENARREFTGNLQFTEPRGYRAAVLSDALSWAYSTYVEEPLSGPRPINYQALAPSQLRSRVWTAFERRHLISPHGVRRSPVVPGGHAPWTFDLAYRNGALNLISSIAINAPSLETNLGRALVFKGMIDDVAEREHAHGVAIVQLPKNPDGIAGVQEAQQILYDAKIEVVNVLNLAQLVDQVAADLDVVRSNVKGPAGRQLRR